MLVLLTLCSLMGACSDLMTNWSCGWCWDPMGGRVGNLTQPLDGLPCHDWTGSVYDCHKEVDCDTLPSCINILGTSCTWHGLTDPTKCPKRPEPHQLRLLYDTTYMNITWVSDIQAPSFAMVNGERLEATSWVFQKWNELGSPYYYRVRVPLTRSAYFYYVVTGSYSSRTYYFQSPTDKKLLIWGDMGRIGGGYILPQIIQEAPHTDMVIHIGDFAYDLHSSQGLNGDAFMDRIEPISATVPYMTVPGNHEAYQQFVHYTQRFTTQRWYFVDTPRARWIFLDSEVYYYDFEHILEQENWLKGVIEHDRHWTFAFYHRPMYCSNNNHDDCAVSNWFPLRARLEPLLKHVDIIFEAHEHSVEFIYPIYNGTVTQRHWKNPTAPVHIVSGFAGCNEFGGLCLNPIQQNKNYTAFSEWRQGRYSYLRLFLNDTCAHVQNYVVESQLVTYEIFVLKEVE
jgi:acid phosphatase type 7